MGRGVGERLVFMVWAPSCTFSIERLPQCTCYSFLNYWGFVSCIPSSRRQPPPHLVRPQWSHSIKQKNQRVHPGSSRSDWCEEFHHFDTINRSKMSHSANRFSVSCRANISFLQSQLKIQDFTQLGSQHTPLKSNSNMKKSPKSWMTSLGNPSWSKSLSAVTPCLTSR